MNPARVLLGAGASGQRVGRQQQRVVVVSEQEEEQFQLPEVLDDVSERISFGHRQTYYKDSVAAL